MKFNSETHRLQTSLTGKGATLLLRGGRILNVFSGEVYSADVLILGREIVSVGERYSDAEQVLDCCDRFILPGFIDGHIHLESSMLHPAEFARLALLHGTTAVVADPHEIANVLGMKGIEFILKATADIPLDVYLMAPSCVPATTMESAGASIGLADINKLMKLERVLGLAEFMNYPAVIAGTPDALARIAAARNAGKIVDGHAPGLRGSGLQTYILAGIGSDHECTTREEAREKLRAGMRVMIRDGSAARNLNSLLPTVNASDSRRCFFVSDDRHPGDLLNDGHMDAILRRAVAIGLDAATAVQMVTLNTAEYFRLPAAGAVAPGYMADLVVVENLEQFAVTDVVKSGNLVIRSGKLNTKIPTMRDPVCAKAMKPASLALKDFRIPARSDNVKVIRVLPHQIVTHRWVTHPAVVKGNVVADPERDIAKVAVIERHHKTGNIGLGLVAGFGLRKGALASSVAHDSHNIVVVGMDDKDMLVAVRRLTTLGGGLVAVANGKVAAELALPIAGLMSTASAEDVTEDFDRLRRVVHNWGCRIDNPFATMSFLALPVIPELKLTDKGLVDVNSFRVVSLWGET